MLFFFLGGGRGGSCFLFLFFFFFFFFGLVSFVLSIDINAIIQKCLGAGDEVKMEGGGGGQKVENVESRGGEGGGGREVKKEEKKKEEKEKRKKKTSSRPLFLDFSGWSWKKDTIHCTRIAAMVWSDVLLLLGLVSCYG